MAKGRLTIVCDRRVPSAEAEPMSKPVLVSVDYAVEGGLDAALPRRTHIARSDAFWDFIHVWVLERDGAVDVAVDYGVLD